MKLSLRLLVLASVLAMTPYLSATERWSTDETAVRMGVRSWLALQGATSPENAAAEVKALYVTLPAAPVSPESARPATASQPENVVVKIAGNRAVATFELQQPPTQVVLQWERRLGLWKIARETITPMAPKTKEQVAFSELPQK